MEAEHAAPAHRSTSVVHMSRSRDTRLTSGGKTDAEVTTGVTVWRCEERGRFSNTSARHGVVSVSDKMLGAMDGKEYGALHAAAAAAGYTMDAGM